MVDDAGTLAVGRNEVSEACRGLPAGSLVHALPKIAQQSLKTTEKKHILKDFMLLHSKIFQALLRLNSHVLPLDLHWLSSRAPQTLRLDPRIALSGAEALTGQDSTSIRRGPQDHENLMVL